MHQTQDMCKGTEVRASLKYLGVKEEVSVAELVHVTENGVTLEITSPRAHWSI